MTMRLCVVTGGARSGKSRFALARAAASAEPVTYVATARASDEEMARRIERHRRERPVTWHTIEAPCHAGRAIRDATTRIVVLDCLTVLAGNALAGATTEEDVVTAIAAETEDILSAIATRNGSLIVVTNEVGLGVHPPTALGRWFRDGLGMANQRLAAVADELVLMVAGRPLTVAKRDPEPPA